MTSASTYRIRGGGDPLAVLLCLMFLAAVPVASRGADAAPTAEEQESPYDMHAKVFVEDQYPSAIKCKTCHEKHFQEWAVSQHAYAMMSPVFVTMQKAVVMLTNGTSGDFCIRCHNPIGMHLGEKISMDSLDRHDISLEGVTCIVCHRVNESFGKISGRTTPQQGNLFSKVYGPEGNERLEEALETPAFNLTTTKEKAGRQVHNKAEKFFQLTKSGFCGTCHDVNNVNQFRLEEAFSDFKHSPAAAKGTSCQDCHMSTEPGLPSGYARGPAAVVGTAETPERKLTNHFFAGPDYSAIHPGLFPFNKEAREFATPKEWISFDYKAGWGTPEFEDDVPEGTEFPERWELYEERESAAWILEKQFERLDWAREQRRTVLRNALRIGDVKIDKSDDDDLEFRIQVKNITEGHSVPVGFIAERLFWLHVVVKDADGQVVFESGDLDPNGDVRDSHSKYVHDKLLPEDEQLYNLQSQFIVRLNRGGEHNQILPINFSPDPLPFLRPATNAAGVFGRPAGGRIHRKIIAPMESHWPRYRVRRRDGFNGPLTIQTELKAAMIPVHLVDRIKVAGFDYGMSARDVAEGVVAGHIVIDEKTVPLGSTGRTE